MLLYIPRVEKKGVKLSLVRVSETDIPPRENVSYSKETQTFGLEPPEREGMHLLWHFSPAHDSYWGVLTLKVHKILSKSEYDQEIPQSHTADQPTAP